MKWNMTCFDALSPFSFSFQLQTSQSPAISQISRILLSPKLTNMRTICELQSNKTLWESSMIGHYKWNKDVKLKKKSQRKCFQITLHSRFLFLAIRSGLSVEITLCKKSNFCPKSRLWKKSGILVVFHVKKYTFDSNMQSKKWIFGQNVDFWNSVQHVVWKSQKKSHSTLRAKWATFTF